MTFTTIAGDRARLWHGANTDLYPLIEGNVAHVIVDPPYGRFTHTQQRNTRDTDGTVTVAPIPFAALTIPDRDAMLAFCKARVDGWAVVFCEAEQTGMWRDQFDAAGCKDRPPAIWVKPDAQPNFSGSGPGVGCELISLAWCGEGKSKWNGGGKTGVYTFVKRHTGSGHPTEKPLPLMKALITDFTQPGDLIFDPFMGSGSTGVAALELGRRFIGAEMNDDYFAIACRRIEAASKVVSLVTPKPQALALFEGSQYRRAKKREKV